MMNRFLPWLDDRTGYRRLLHEALYENIPGGSRWRYVTGSMLVFAFFTQVVTGLFLWMAYSPSSQTAWESVYYIEYQMQGGWLLRGVHHFMASAMVILLILHLLQVVIDGAYRAPREVNYWLGLVLMLIVLALALTGYLLPWDQKGFWATNVATNLMVQTPGGSGVQQLVVGGSDYGHHTLTRFFALHAGILPALMVLILVIHVALFRRHGITAKTSGNRPDEYFWPRQVLKDALACLVVLAIVLAFVLFRGADLGSPADPSEPYAAPRPEWYFLFLFQLLKLFEGGYETIGTVWIPGLTVLTLFLMPILGRWVWGHRFNVGFILLLIAGSGLLTFAAWRGDNYYELAGRVDPEEAQSEREEERLTRSRDFLKAKAQAHADAVRIRELARRYGIPSQGAITLLREDPVTQGPRLFARHCASCHSWLDDKGNGVPGPKHPKPQPDGSTPPYGAPNLYQFASRDWIAGLLDAEQVSGEHYFGKTAHKENDAGMVEFVTSDLSALDEVGKKRLDQIIAALSAEAGLPDQRSEDEQARADGTIAAGRAAMSQYFDSYSCTECHRFHNQGELGSAPDLTGYGSYGWIARMISTPQHETLYADRNDRMPAFHADISSKINTLTDQELDLLVRWLRGDRSLKRPQRK